MSVIAKGIVTDNIGKVIISGGAAPNVVSGTLFTIPSATTDISVATQSPFAGGGNSYQFNASTSHIDINADATLAMGTGDFTIEWFQYQTDSNNFPRIFAIGTYPNQSIGCSIEGGTFYAWCTGANSFGSVTPYKNVWVHFAIVRRSGTLYVYKNGVSIGTPLANSVDITNASSTLWIGKDVTQGDNTAFGGYITNYRWTKGLAIYTGNFAVPTGALTLTATANPFGGSNTVAIPDGNVKILLVP